MKRDFPTIGKNRSGGFQCLEKIFQPLECVLYALRRTRHAMLFALLCSATFAGSWFPEQRAPKGVLTVGIETKDRRESILAASLAGLAARAVNEGTGDELVWIGSDSKGWKQRTVGRLGLEDRGTLPLVEAISRHRENIKGYVLYSYDGGSANRATVVAGFVRGLLVDESQESEIRMLGFSQLFDARNATSEEVFERAEKHLNRNMVFSIDPTVGNLRGLAIAHRAFATYGTNEAVWATYDEMIPPFAVIGWGAGDEFKHVAPATRRGGFETVSNWARNLTVLSAGAAEYQPKKIRRFDPAAIDWQDTRRCVAFMMSDGDNTGWMLGNFWGDNYFGSPLTGSFPMGFSAALGGMAQMAPVVLDRMAEEQPGNVSLIQFGGGYFYPDLFAENRPNRWELLRQHARRIGAQMERTGATVMCFIASDSGSSDAKKAYKIFAEEINGLAGMLVMDYAPYHKGEGKIHWAKNKKGERIPAVTARFCLWEGMKRPLAGDPEKLADTINADDEDFAWTAVHAWSKFKNPDTGETDSGTAAVGRCVDGIDNNKINVVSPEELIWRIRKGK